MIWLYLFSGGLALYSVETADSNQPLLITVLVALFLCVIPASIDAFISSGKTMHFGRMMRKSILVDTDE